MSQENNVRVEEAPTSPEEAHTFLSRCDDHIRSVTIPLQRACVARIAYGDAQSYAVAEKDYIAAMEQDESTLAALVALAQNIDEPLSHWTRMVRRFFTIPEERRLQEEINRTLQQWRITRAQLTSPELGIHGAWALMTAMMTEKDHEKRKMLFTALHARDEELAQLMISLRDAKRVCPAERISRLL